MSDAGKNWNVMTDCDIYSYDCLNCYAVDTVKGHPVFIAQHATATCCRGCLKKWYQIEKGRALTDNEIGFVVDLLMGWIEEQVR